MFDWLRKNWVAALIVVAIPASFLLSRHDAHSRDAAQTRRAVAECKRSSARTAVTAQGFRVLSQRVRLRGNPGDVKSSNRYEATANSTLAKIPAPRGLRNRESLISASLESAAGGMTYRYVLTKNALRLQDMGCREAFG